MRRIPMLVAASVGLSVVALLAGCAAPAGAGDTVRLVIKDNELRVPGDPCNGPGPFKDVHATAAYAVRDADGNVLGEGELPQGVAGKMLDIDFNGIAEPTKCTFALVASIPDDSDEAYLDIGERTGIVMMKNRDDDVWEAILP